MPTDVRDLIAKEVRAEMARQDKTQDDMAVVLDVDQAAISLRLRGKRSFRAEELVKIAAWLGVSATKFIPETADLTEAVAS